MTTTTTPRPATRRHPRRPVRTDEVQLTVHLVRTDERSAPILRLTEYDDL